MSWSSIKLSRLPDATLSVWGHTATLSGEKDIVVFGGFDFCLEKPTNTTYILHTSQTNGLTKPSVSGTLPPPIYGHSSTQVGRKMFVFGGNLQENVQVNDMYQFNTSNYSWSKPRPMGEPPMPRYGHSASLIYDNYILIFGGNNTKSSKPLNDIHIFNTERNSWTKPSSNSSTGEIIFNPHDISPRSSTTTPTHQSVNGSSGSGSGSSRVRSATISSHNNSPIVMPLSSNGGNPTNINGSPITTPPTLQQLHLSQLMSTGGGIGGNGNSDSPPLTPSMIALETSMLNGFKSPLSLSQRLLRSGFRSSPPSPRYFHSCSVINGKAFIFGGYNGTSLLNDLYVLNIESMEWICPPTKGDLPTPRAGHTSIAIGTRLFIFGGAIEGDPSSSNAHCDNDLYMFEPELNYWTLLKTSGTLPSPRTGHVCLPISSKILIIGGSDAILNNKLKLSNTYHSLETLKLDFSHHNHNHNRSGSVSGIYPITSSNSTSSNSIITNYLPHLKPRSSGGSITNTPTTTLLHSKDNSTSPSPLTPRSIAKNSPKSSIFFGKETIDSDNNNSNNNNSNNNNNNNNLLNSLQEASKFELSPGTPKSIRGVDTHSSVSLTQSFDRNNINGSNNGASPNDRGEFLRHYTTQSILLNKNGNGGSGSNLSISSNNGSGGGSGSNNSISSNDGLVLQCSTPLCIKKYNALKDSYLDLKQKYQEEREKRLELEKELEHFRISSPISSSSSLIDTLSPNNINNNNNSSNNNTTTTTSTIPLSTSNNSNNNNSTLPIQDQVTTSKQILEIYEDIYNLWGYYEKRVKWKETIEKEANQQLEVIKLKIDQFTCMVGLENHFNLNDDTKSSCSESVNSDLQNISQQQQQQQQHLQTDDNISETNSQISEPTLIQETLILTPRRSRENSVHHSRSVSNPIPLLSQIVKQHKSSGDNSSLTVPQQLHSSHNNLIQLATTSSTLNSPASNLPTPQKQQDQFLQPNNGKNEQTKSTQKIFKLLISKKNRASGHFKLSASNESSNSEETTPTFSNHPNLTNDEEDDSNVGSNSISNINTSNSTTSLSSSVSSTSLQTQEEFEANERSKQKKRLGKALKQMINKDRQLKETAAALAGSNNNGSLNSNGQIGNLVGNSNNNVGNSVNNLGGLVLTEKEKEKQEKEREKLERIEREKQEKEREKQEKEREKQEKIEREKLEKAEKERLEREKAEKEKLEKKHKKIKGLFGAKNSNKESLPFRRDVIEKVINHLREHSLDTEGIFRLSGNMESVRGIVKSFAHGEPNLNFEVHNISNALKHYLRSLDPPLIPYEFFLMLLDARKNEDAETIRNIFWKIPSDNRVVLTLLVDLMVKISENSNVNKMNSKNLSIVFGPTILKPRTPTLDRMALMTETQLQCGIIQTFIEDFHYIFSEFPTSGPKSFLGDDDYDSSSFGSNNTPSSHSPHSSSPTLHSDGSNPTTKTTTTTPITTPTTTTITNSTPNIIPINNCDSALCTPTTLSTTSAIIQSNSNNTEINRNS
ncbi:hypothetical protein RB653_010164 [Dictyostelium firmibasis]|uniref:Rho-GAP domain-containing protein n=1 Tax=Dictyostelium firmibasis TaxID=79012 RepID=A0AAN7YVC1_9MYCE